jgi:tetratricopeptide (TPR) repeat protein
VVPPVTQPYLKVQPKELPVGQQTTVAEAFRQRGVEYLTQNDVTRAEQDFLDYQTLVPDSPYAIWDDFLLGLAQRNWEKMIAASQLDRKLIHQRLLELDPNDYLGSYVNALVASGQLTNYREFIAELLERHSQTDDPKIARSLTALLLVGPDAVDDWSLPLRLSQLVLNSGSGDPRVTSHVSELLCRAGVYERSLELRAEAIAEGGREPHAWDCFWQAMAHQGLGNIDQARVLASKARELADSGKLGAPNSTTFEFMHRELTEKLDASPLPLGGEVGLSGPGEGNSSEKVKPNDTIR